MSCLKLCFCSKWALIVALFQILFSCFSFLLQKRTHELEAAFQHCFCCWYMYLKIKNDSSKSDWFFCPCSKTPHTLHLLLSAELCWECQHTVRFLHSNEFPRCPSSRRLEIPSRYIPVFSQHLLWPNKLFCCDFMDLGRWRKEGYLDFINVFMKTKKCNGFSAELVFNGLATLKLQEHSSSGVLKH